MGERHRRPDDVAVVVDVEPALEDDVADERMTEEGNGQAAGEVVVYLARMPSGPLVVLEGSAALIWTELTAGSGLEAALVRLGQTFDQPVEVLRPHVSAFAADLVARGLLEQG